MINFRRVYLLSLVVAAACGGGLSSSDETTPDGSSPTNKDGAASTDGQVTKLPDGGVPTKPGTIDCGDASCVAASQTCCVTTQSRTCIAQGGACQGGAALACSNAASCTSGNVCCLELQQATSTCKPSCAGGLQEPQLCESDNECKSPDTCRMVAGVQVCAPPQPDGGGFKFDAGGFGPKDGGGVPGFDF